MSVEEGTVGNGERFSDTAEDGASGSSVPYTESPARPGGGVSRTLVCTGVGCSARIGTSFPSAGPRRAQECAPGARARCVMLLLALECVLRIAALRYSPYNRCSRLPTASTRLTSAGAPSSSLQN